MIIRDGFRGLKLWAFGFVAAFFSIYILVHYVGASMQIASLRELGIQATASVMNLHWNHGKGDNRVPSAHVIFSHNGQTRTTEVEVSKKAFASLREGQKIEIKFLAQDPSKACLLGDGNPWLDNLWFAGGAALAAVLLGYLGWRWGP